MVGSLKNINITHKLYCYCPNSNRVVSALTFPCIRKQKNSLREKLYRNIFSNLSTYTYELILISLIDSLINKSHVQNQTYLIPVNIMYRTKHWMVLTLRSV